MHLTFPIRGDKLSMNVEVSAHLAHRVSPFQTIDVYDTIAFGKVLFLDGHVQLASLDEAAYHESLVHVPLLSVDTPIRALVIGGGDGGVLRELAKHRSLQEMTMVEIDQAVIDVAREHLPEISNLAFEDPRLNLKVMDAFDFVKGAQGTYDLIVMDSTDVYEDEEGGLSEQLWTKDFYADLHRLLSPQGFLVTQADNLVFCPYSLEGILKTFGEVFAVTGAYQAVIPSFGGFSGYAWASKGASVRTRLPANDLRMKYLNQATYDFAMTPLGYGVF